MLTRERIKETKLSHLHRVAAEQLFDSGSLALVESEVRSLVWSTLLFLGIVCVDFGTMEPEERENRSSRLAPAGHRERYRGFQELAGPLEQNRVEADRQAALAVQQMEGLNIGKPATFSGDLDSTGRPTEGWSGLLCTVRAYAGAIHRRPSPSGSRS